MYRFQARKGIVLLWNKINIRPTASGKKKRELKAHARGRRCRQWIFGEKDGRPSSPRPSRKKKGGRGKIEKCFAQLQEERSDVFKTSLFSQRKRGEKKGFVGRKREKKRGNVGLQILKVLPQLEKSFSSNGGKKRIGEERG